MRVLISAASKHGATAEIADALGAALRAHGHQVEVADPDTVTDLSVVDAVIIGSGVYAGHWLHPAVEFTRRFAGELAHRPVWLFSSGPLGNPPKPEEDPVDITPLMSALRARGHRLFAGELDKASLSFPERAIVAALRAPYGDFRDWNVITMWANELADALGQETLTAGAAQERSDG